MNGVLSLMRIIGAGASKFLGVRRIFARTSPNLPENFCVPFDHKFSPTKIMKTFFWWDLQKKVLICFSATVGRHFLKSNNVGCHFCPDFQGFCSDFQGFCSDFQRFCPNFQGFCPDFWLIKIFGGVLSPPAPLPRTPLMRIDRWTAQKIPFRTYCIFLFT